MVKTSPYREKYAEFHLCFWLPEHAYCMPYTPFVRSSMTQYFICSNSEQYSNRNDWDKEFVSSVWGTHCGVDIIHDEWDPDICIFYVIPPPTPSCALSGAIIRGLPIKHQLRSKPFSRQISQKLSLFQSISWMIPSWAKKIHQIMLVRLFKSLEKSLHLLWLRKTNSP